MVAAAKGLDTVVHIPCHVCSRDYIVLVNNEDMTDYLSGSGLIQDIMPYLSDNDREMIISSTCADCWDKLFG